MTTAVLSSLKTAKAVKSRSKTKPFEAPQINWVKFCVLGSVLCVTSLSFYVLQINALTNRSYLIGKYESEMREISQENKRLEISFAEKALLGNMAERAQLLSLQKTAAVKYIQVSELTMAGSK